MKDRGENIPAEDIKKCAREIKVIIIFILIKEKYGYVVDNGNLIEEFKKFDRKKEIAPG